jgi:glutamate carboxypeptidase
MQSMQPMKPTRTYSQDFLPQLQALQAEMLERLAILVNIDSGSGQVEGVNHVMSHLEQWLQDIGFNVTRHYVEGLGNNLVARRQGKGKLRILLVGHVDTVYDAGAAATVPFSVKVGLSHGPGVIDMKSGDIMGLYALRVLLESGFEEYGELIVLFNNDEEVGSFGSEPLLRDIAQAVDVGLVLEGSRSPEIVTRARKGADKYILEVTGVPAHSGAEPYKGRSAVVEMAHKILAIHNLNTLFPGVTLNVTKLTSSERLNIVPDFARCHISVRAFNTQGLELAAQALEQIVTSRNVPDTRTRLIRTRGRIPYTATPEILQMVEAARIEGEALELHIVAESKGGLSDANILMEAGIPTLDSLGPVGGGMHDLNREFMRVDSLPLRGALLAGLITRLCLSERTG